MAITQDYVSAAGTEGNDYKGASFADGAYAKATKTLTKAGAFTASKVNHYIYITGTHITSGYYKISDVTGAPNAVVLATDASSDGNDSTDVHCTQADGSTTLPWRSLQGAFDLCTRNATDGNQVNLKAGTAQVNAAALDLTTFIAGSAMAATKPLIVRGYTAAANDGGIGEIDCGGATMWAAATYDYIQLIDLEIHSFGDADGIVMDQGTLLYHCEVHRGASNPVARNLILGSGYGQVVGCYIHGTGTGAARGVSTVASVVGNYILMDAGTDAIGIYTVSQCINNIVVCGDTSAIGIDQAQWMTFGNIIINTTAGTKYGIRHSTTTVATMNAIIMNNIVCGFSGAGGEGILTTNVGTVGYNAFWNNTATYTNTDQVFLDLTAYDVALAASPFTSPATGDFSLTAAGKAALRGLGWPGAYLGAHANTDGHITIGAVQYGEAEAGGSGVVRRIARILGG